MEYPSFKLVIVGDGGTGISLFTFFIFVEIFEFILSLFVSNRGVRAFDFHGGGYVFFER